MFSKKYASFVPMALSLSMIANTAFGKGVEAKDLFLECRVTTTITKPSELTEKQLFNYLVDTNNGDIRRYNEITNTYDPFCEPGTGVTCAIDKNTISMYLSVDKPESTRTDSLVINRWSGKYNSMSKLTLRKSDAVFEAYSVGTCDTGSDRRVPNQKF